MGPMGGQTTSQVPHRACPVGVMNRITAGTLLATHMILAEVSQPRTISQLPLDMDKALASPTTQLSTPTTSQRMMVQGMDQTGLTVQQQGVMEPSQARSLAVVALRMTPGEQQPASQ